MIRVVEDIRAGKKKNEGFLDGVYLREEKENIISLFGNILEDGGSLVITFI